MGVLLYRHWCHWLSECCHYIFGSATIALATQYRYLCHTIPLSTCFNVLPSKANKTKGLLLGFFFFFFASMKICFCALLIFCVGRFRTTFLAIELFPLMEMHIMYVMYSCPGFMYSAQKLILNRVVKTVTICIPLFWVVKNISVFSFSCPIP